MMLRFVVPLMAIPAATLKPAGRAVGLPKCVPRKFDSMSRLAHSIHARPTASSRCLHENRLFKGCWAPFDPLRPHTSATLLKRVLSGDTPEPGHHNFVSRRNMIRGFLWATGMYHGSGAISCASAYTVDRVKPDEKDTYWQAQDSSHPLRILWVGSGNMNGVYNNLFQAGNEVTALDLLRPDNSDLSAATTYATEHGYQLRFEQGDATKLGFTDETFDVVVCSMFLCQDFDPQVVVSEIRRVLKPGGRFGFYEHVEDINKVIVDRVFGERSIVQVQAYPERTNVMAGVVKKV